MLRRQALGDQSDDRDHGSKGERAAWPWATRQRNERKRKRGLHRTIAKPAWQARLCATARVWCVRRPSEAAPSRPPGRLGEGRPPGILIKIEADSLLVIFRRTASALECAVEMQQTLRVLNMTRPPETEILWCVGIGYGEMLRIGDLDVWGREVNAASKLGEDTAKAGEILLTKAAVESAGTLRGITFERIEARVGGSAENYQARY